MEQREHLYFVGYVNWYSYNTKECGGLKTLKKPVQYYKVISL